jgi:hypothetical protein
MVNASNDQALVYQVLDEVVAGRPVSPRSRAIIHSVIDRQRSGPGITAEVHRTEDVSIALHKLEWALRRGDRETVEEVRQNLKSIAVEFLNQSIHSRNSTGSMAVV